MRAHLTPQAEIDLEEVGDYIAGPGVFGEDGFSPTFAGTSGAEKFSFGIEIQAGSLQTQAVRPQ